MEGGIDLEFLDLSALPENCISRIISFTSPIDACRLSLLCSAFQSAAGSDEVWLRFLPSDCASIVSRSSSSSSLPLTPAKNLYFRLWRAPILLDGGRVSFSLEKFSGKKCFMFASRELAIVWGDTPRYWTWTSLPESRFSEVAVLIDVCWLEISGQINVRLLSSNTNYGLYFVFKWAGRPSGFRNFSLEFSTRVSGCETVVRLINLCNDEVCTREDGWYEVEFGEFFMEGDQGDDAAVVEMRAAELSGHWKRGLVVEGIEIRPKTGSRGGTTWPHIQTQHEEQHDVAMVVGSGQNEGHHDVVWRGGRGLGAP